MDFSSLPSASTIDPVADLLAIQTNSLNSTQGISRNTFLSLASAPVGLTDSQTLTNKVLTSPTISNPTFSGTLSGTYTIGGTPTFPASVVTLTGSQTLTNKVLTSPTINSPTITNATLNADTITGFTSSTNGTIYGMSITGGTIGNAALAANSVNTSQIISGIQLPDKMKNPYKFSVYRNAAQNIGTNAYVVLQCDTKIYDTGSNVDVVTNKGRFTAPIAGFYQFNALVQALVNGTAIMGISLFKNGSRAIDGGLLDNTATASAVSNSVNVSATIQLAAGDYVEAQIYGNSGYAINVGTSNASYGASYFQGFLESAT